MRTAKVRSGKMRSEMRTGDSKWRVLREVAKQEETIVLNDNRFRFEIP